MNGRRVYGSLGNYGGSTHHSNGLARCMKRCRLAALRYMPLLPATLFAQCSTGASTLYLCCLVMSGDMSIGVLLAIETETA
jgi:hypothetical protein